MSLSKARTRLFLLPLLAIAVAPAAFAATVVIPNFNETAEGNEANAFPFGVTAASNEPYRYQQVYAASGFGEQAEPITIDEIRFRPDSSNQIVTTITVQSIEVRLSTTSALPDGLDNAVFDNNIGPDATLVYSGSLLWPIPTTGSTPRPFDFPITFTTPFVYDPSAGNLLVEVYNLSETFPLENTLDVENATDETSRVVEVVIPSTGDHVIPPIGVGSRGLVTQFVYNTPEPASVSAGAVALLALASLRRSRSA